jgi:hypothetical protein
MWSYRTGTMLLPLMLVLAGCDSNPADPDTIPQLSPVKSADLAVCDPGGGPFLASSTNPWFPIQVGYTWSYEGEEDGELLELRITVLDQTEVVSGVTTRVVEEREWIEGKLVEVSRNYFAMAPDGTVCYFGEAVDIYDPETGQIVSHEGAWRADESGNAPGIIMPGDPAPGLVFVMEVAPGIAEDQGKVIGSGPVEVGGETFTRTIRLREFNPLDGDKGYKVYAYGIGLIIDGPAELVSYDLTP